jgi:chlorophyll synthase
LPGGSRGLGDVYKRQFMLVAQWAVAILLGLWGSPMSALAVLVLSLCQLPLMIRFVQSPVEKALSVSAFGVPLFVSGMMVSAWALRALEGEAL